MQLIAPQLNNISETVYMCVSTGIWSCYVPLVDRDALAAYLIRQGAMSAIAELEARQGIEMGSPGHLLVRQTESGTIEIRGQAVSIYRGHLTL